MSRPAISVRHVSAAEERSFTELWMSSRVEAGISPEVAARAASEGRISTALQRDDVRAYVATADGLAVGFAVAATSPLLCVPSIVVTIPMAVSCTAARRSSAARINRRPT